jgi:hypothetical protein
VGSARQRNTMKNIVIFYTPGAYGSFLAWMIERFNTARQAHEPAVIDNPLQPDGSSHSYATLCKLSPVSDIEDFLKDTETNPWGYRIWAGWPVTNAISLDQAIETTLKSMQSQDHLIVVSRTTQWEALLCWLNAGSKLEQRRWFNTLGITNETELIGALQRELDNRFFNRVDDPRLLEISINEILFAPTARVLSLVTELGFDICDAELLNAVLTEKRRLQYNISMLNNIESATSSPAVNSIKELNG